MRKSSTLADQLQRLLIAVGGLLLLGSCGGLLLHPAEAQCATDAVTRAASGFVAVRSEAEMLCHLNSRKLDPFNDLWAAEAYRLIEQLAIWVQTLSPANGTTVPKIKFAYYPASLGEFGSCERNRVGSYARSSGAGAPMCALLEETSSLGGGSLADYLVQLLDVGKTQDSNGDPQEFFDSVKDITSLTRQLGFEPYQRFVHSFNTRFVYDPKDDEFGFMSAAINTSSPTSKYFGLSGGGGSGAGFGIFCRYGNGTQETILRGGGGGGGGGSAPGGIDQTLEAGGGGSGGVTTGSTADGILRIDPVTKIPVYAPQVYAVADLSPFGKVTTYPDPVLDNSYNAAIGAGIRRIQTCKQRGGEVWINGGGGGGAGFEWYTKPVSQQTDGDQKTALNVGYGFQFAVGEGNKLTKHGFPKLPLSVMVCPYIRRTRLGLREVDWEQCFPQKDEDEIDRDDSAEGQTQTPTSQPTSTQLYSCLGRVIPEICGQATYLDAQTNKTVPYTKYGNYVGCNCPLSNWYKKSYGTAMDKVYEPQCKGPKPSSPRYVPVLDRDTFDIRWCNKVEWKTCPILKECLSKAPTREPTKSPTSQPTSRPPTTGRPSRSPVKPPTRRA